MDMKTIDLNGILWRIERRYLVRALEATGNNRTLACKLLGIPRPTLVMKLRKFNLIRTMPSRKGNPRHHEQG